MTYKNIIRILITRGGIMHGIFDIRPPVPHPKRKETTKISSKPKINSRKHSGIFVFIIIVLGTILLFGLLSDNQTQPTNNDEKQQNKINTLGVVKIKDANEVQNDNSQPINSSSTQPNSNPKPSIESTETPNSATGENIEITVLNGGAGSGAAEKIKNELEENEIKVANIGNTKSNYARTVIYYTNVNLPLAEKIQETLANYNPKIEEDNELVNDSKIIIVIGSN